MLPQSFVLATYYLLVEIIAYGTTQIDQVVRGNYIQPLSVESNVDRGIIISKLMDLESASAIREMEYQWTG